MGFESQNSSLIIKSPSIHMLSSLSSLFSLHASLLQQLPMWTPNFQLLCLPAWAPKSSHITLCSFSFLRHPFSRAFLVACGLKSGSDHLGSRAVCSLATRCQCCLITSFPWQDPSTPASYSAQPS